MKALLLPTYFPSISQFAVMMNADSVTFEMDDNFQKQTNRNRMYVYSPNGIQLLNIPVKHGNGKHQKTRDVKIEDAFDWQKLHFKSLEAAYRSSPFFEFFEDDIRPIFEKKHTFLTDLNFAAFDIVCHCLGLAPEYEKTTEYFHEPEGFTDFRFLANGKKDTTILETYTQVFEEKHGFINNLSILDLLFNEGRKAVDYLENQKIILP
ncbi:hypothetical protein GV828_04770 [Flavobacterium sp. NST-5]|uniref:WbqC-like protein n=1 Tax=Flavobacterium ichthyis TaxID=2698827 RepID=A0ABW9ZB21_9FLAO|nr:WbqC family protein [Flavobacterium ichthyis]NBL64512.1 hypothetical protein [Flavobacterium ichthyis]